MPFEFCRYLRYKELFEPECAAACRSDPGMPAVAHAWCNRTLKETGGDGRPVSMAACSRPGRACYRLHGGHGEPAAEVQTANHGLR